MGGLVSGLANAASSMLGGGATPPPAPKMQQAPAVFKKAGAIDDPQGNAPGATALDHPNVFDPKMPIWFIHFGNVLSDVHDRFNHPAIDDTKAATKEKDALPSPRGTRAIMFRAALEREAILCDGFMSCARNVVQEMKDSEGSVSQAIGAVSSLMGGSTAAAGPDPGQIDPYKSAVGTAGGSINKAAIHYADIFQTGQDLNQAWYNFDAFAPSMAKPSGEKGGGLLGNLPSALPMPSLPGVGGALDTVTGILFKMFDIYEAIYLKLRARCEPVIRDQCYARSMEAIRSRYTPVFDVWSAQPPDVPDPASPAQILKISKTGVDPVDDTVSSVNSTYDDVLKKKDEIQNKWKNLWDAAPLEGPGQAQVTAIIAAFAKPDDMILDGFRTALKIGDLPGFIKTAIGKITAATAGMLGQIYLLLQDQEVARQMDEGAFLAGGRKYFENVLSGLANDLIPAFGANIPGLSGVTSAMMAKKSASLLDDQVGRDIDPILELAMGAVHDVLQKARASAAASQSVTMEVYFAQLPQLVALITRNTFFPIWQLVVGRLFDALGMGAALAMSPVSKLMQTGRDTAAGVKHEAQDLDSSIKDKANDVSSSVQDKENQALAALSAVNVNVAGDPLGGMPGSAAQGIGGLADSILGKADGAAGTPGAAPSFPGAARLTSGSGIEIKLAEWKQVDARQQQLTVT